jgi:plastocyanin
MAQVTVTIANMTYSPDPVEIKVGDSVVWSNQDRMAHTATADDGSFDTGKILPRRLQNPSPSARREMCPIIAKFIPA